MISTGKLSSSSSKENNIQDIEVSDTCRILIKLTNYRALVFVHVHSSLEHSVHSIHAVFCILYFRHHSSVSKTKSKFKIIMYSSALLI